MEINLCFGVFARLMNLCRDEARISNQANFIASLIYIVDKKNSSLLKIQDDCTIIGNEIVASRLINCMQNFSYGKDDKNNKNNKNNNKNNKQMCIDRIHNQREFIIGDFEDLFLNYMDMDKIPKLIVAFNHIIRNDIYVNKYKKEVFKSLFGLYREKLNFENGIIPYEFLWNLYMYTLISEIKSKQYKESISIISMEYIEKIYRPYINLIVYDASSNTVSFKLLFDIYHDFMGLLDKYHIIQFLTEIDPTICVNEIWIDRCDDFIHECETVFSQYNIESRLLKKVGLFCKVLSKYIDYLGINMYPLLTQTVINGDSLETVNIKHPESVDFGYTNLYFKDMETFYQFSQKVNWHRRRCNKYIEDINCIVKPFLTGT